MGDGELVEGRGRAIARWLLIAFYGFAGVAHVTFATDAMVRIVPAWVPQPRAVVIATGLCELAGAIGLMTTRWRQAAGGGLAAYALCVWPANVVHAIHDLGQGTELGWWYHYPRLALQPAIIWWALWASGAVRGAKRQATLRHLCGGMSISIVEIVSIRHKALRSFAETGRSKGLPGNLVDRLRNMLAYLSVIEIVEELKAPPNFGAHVLTGDRAGTWSLTVTKNWRMTFRVSDAGAIEDVDLEDYH